VQVKLLGMRVELGEVEVALAETPGVELAVAVVLKDPAGAQRLVAYVTPAAVQPAAAVAAIRARLPAHMVPSVVVPLDAMPRLPNGKISRAALPAPDWGAGAADEYVAPAGELEAQLQAVWQEVLGRERISAQADFFAIGGNSLQARAMPCGGHAAMPMPCMLMGGRPSAISCHRQPLWTCAGSRGLSSLVLLPQNSVTPGAPLCDRWASSWPRCAMRPARASRRRSCSGRRPLLAWPPT
jgi:hypothetical protein